MKKRTTCGFVAALLAAVAARGAPTPAVPDVPAAYQKNLAIRKILIREIRIEDNTILDFKTINGLLGEYIGRDLSYEELQQLRTRLSQAYVEKGYVNSGVLLPDQEIKNGTIVFKAVEGKLNTISLQGNRHLRNSYLEKRIRSQLNGTLNLVDLERSLRLMQQRPLIAQVNAELLPGAQRGQSILDLRVRERDPITVVASYDNHRSPSVGEDHFTLSATHQSFTGNGDALSATYGYADGADDWSISYAFPLTAEDLAVEAYYSQGDSDIVERPFAELDIVSETSTWGARLSRPLIRTLNQTLLAGIGFEHKRSESTLLGEPFSFSAGEKDGKSRVSAAQLFADWTVRGESQALALRATIRQGVDWLNSTDNSSSTVDDLPDSTFTTVLLQAQYARRLPFWGWQLQARLTGQAASEPLLPIERLAVGGSGTVRGYRENLLVRDQGVIAGLELRIPIWTNDAGESRIGLTFAPFYDYGWAKDKAIGLPGLDNPEGDDISSVGAGLLWNGWKPLYVEAYYGADLKDRSSSSSDSLQEDGIHLLATFRQTF